MVALFGITDTEMLEDVQLNVARIVTGAMHCKSISKLYEETGWQTLAKRRGTSKLILMYKQENGLVPNTLCSIISVPARSDIARYNTRQQFAIPHFRASTGLFESFFPSTVRLWNQLPLHTRNSTLLQMFKSKLYQPVIKPIKFPQLYNFGDRYFAAQHIQLHIGSSQLNYHLFEIGVKYTAQCSCSFSNEDTWHYFLLCPPTLLLDLSYTLLFQRLHLLYTLCYLALLNVILKELSQSST